MNRQPEKDFTTLLSQWTETAEQPILNRRLDIPTLTILYERLSVDDDFAGESNSIKNQKSLLENHAIKSGFPNIIHLTDDGFSGTRFDRPSFTKAMELVEAGVVGIFAVKDLSRYGRDHLRVGLYTERLRECGVRFIALQDNVDTLNGEDDFTPFRNIINEWAARDASRKVKAIFKAKALEGKHVTGNFPYGYLQDPNDKGKWIVDDETAPIVKRIYQMVVAGYGVYQIAEILSSEKILMPGAHWQKLGVMNRKTHVFADPYLWSGTTIRTMLRKEEYMGHTVNNKTYKNSYKDKQRKLTPKDERLIFEDTHPAIIDPETWHNVQRLIKTVRKPNKYGTINPLTGMLYCPDCGRKMTNHRSIDSPKNGGFADVYICAGYRNRPRKCTMHYIRTVVAQELALEAIRSTCGFVKENEGDFVRLVREASQVQQEETAKAHKKRLAKNEKRITELDTLFKRTYEDFTAGRLTEKRFAQLSSGYESEQETLEQECAGLRGEIEQYAADSVRADKFIELANRYSDFTELTPQMLNEFIDRIIVFEPDKSTGERKQAVEIHLNYIGNFTIPIQYDGLTDEEREAQVALEEKRARQRAYSRNWYAKNKAKKEPAQKETELEKTA